MDVEHTLHVQIADISKQTVSNALSYVPEILIIRCDTKNLRESIRFDKKKTGIQANAYVSQDNYYNIQSMQNVIQYNGAQYTLDSVLLTKDNHEIACIKCAGNKYIYDGKLVIKEEDMDKSTEDIIKTALPCPLMNYEWDVRTNTPFYVYNCNVNSSGATSPYSFQEEKLLIYVRTTMI
jgi:hypothetical protein